ncbi:MAG TPA: hypothetical protein VG405_02140 [Solirubrobacteraceae bacterium]|jgi:hypothetical protein|nr:hypothetical protein [Solirubrobacteraceae bacterium]
MSTSGRAGSESSRVARPVLVGVVRAGLLFALWLLLVDSIDEQNSFVGGGVALLGALLTGLLQFLRPVRLAPRPVMLRYIYRPLALLFTDTLRVAGVLLSSLPRRSSEYGRLRAVRYGACAQDPEQTARRVLTEWGASVGSNRYVIGIDSAAGLLLVHELYPSSGPLDPMELG